MSFWTILAFHQVNRTVFAFIKQPSHFRINFSIEAEATWILMKPAMVQVTGIQNDLIKTMKIFWPWNHRISMCIFQFSQSFKSFCPGKDFSNTSSVLAFSLNISSTGACMAPTTQIFAHLPFSYGSFPLYFCSFGHCSFSQCSVQLYSCQLLCHSVHETMKKYIKSEIFCLYSCMNSTLAWTPINSTLLGEE